jgi:hypothetical protein
VGVLGRSSHPEDPTLRGSISEFRIYAQALDDRALAEVFARGADRL